MDQLARAAALHRDALVWDAHACLPLHPDADLGALARHHAAGVDFVSVNIGMDMNPLTQIMAVLASFRAQLRRRGDLFVQIADAADVERAKAAGKLAVAFDLEGGVPLCERPEMVQLFYDLGVRQIHLAYNRNNSIGGGCYDDDMPLSGLGRRIVHAINRAGMLMDCSHTGYRTSMDIMAVSHAPVIYSHANPLALAANGRNIRDDQIDACVATGGVVCVNGIGGSSATPRRAPRRSSATSTIWCSASAPSSRVGSTTSTPRAWTTGRRVWIARTGPPEHGYGKEGPSLRNAAPEQFPGDHRGPARAGLPRGRHPQHPRRQHAPSGPPDLAAPRGVSAGIRSWASLQGRRDQDGRLSG